MIDFGIDQLPDGGTIFIAQVINDLSHGGLDIVIGEFNRFEDIQWIKAVGGAGDDIGKSIVANGSDGFYIIAETTTYGGSDKDVMLAHFDPYTNLVWACVFDSNQAEQGRKITLGTHGGLGVTLNTQKNDSAEFDAMTVKVNGEGGVEWASVLSTGNIDGGGTGAITNTTKGGFLVTGGTKNYGGFKLYVVNYNATGQIAWMYVFDAGGSADSGKAICPLTDGTTAIAGETFIGGSSQILVIRINSTTGELLWAKEIGGLGDEYTWALSIINGTGIAVMGQSNSYGATGSYDALLVRLHDTGELWYTKLLEGIASTSVYGSVTTSARFVTFVGPTLNTNATTFEMLFARLIDAPEDDCALLINTTINDITTNASYVQVQPNATSVTLTCSPFTPNITDILLPEENTCSQTYGPTFSPTFSPTLTPTQSTALPSNTPTKLPSLSPSQPPTRYPTPEPTLTPTHLPTYEPTTGMPTDGPTADPTLSPTKLPTLTPTSHPSLSPTAATLLPTDLPTHGPTKQPSSHPTLLPTTSSPTLTPTYQPTHIPTMTPSLLTNSPTKTPTPKPIAQMPNTSPTKKPTQDLPSNGNGNGNGNQSPVEVLGKAFGTSEAGGWGVLIALLFGGGVCTVGIIFAIKKRRKAGQANNFQEETDDDSSTDGDSNTEDDTSTDRDIELTEIYQKSGIQMFTNDHNAMTLLLTLGNEGNYED